MNPFFPSWIDYNFDKSWIIIPEEGLEKLKSQGCMTKSYSSISWKMKCEFSTGILQLIRIMDFRLFDVPENMKRRHHHSHQLYNFGKRFDTPPLAFNRTLARKDVQKYSCATRARRKIIVRHSRNDAMR